MAAGGKLMISTENVDSPPFSARRDIALRFEQASACRTSVERHDGTAELGKRTPAVVCCRI